MNHNPKRLEAIVLLAAPDPNAISFRAMFGGVMAYANGKPFASLSNVGLAIKLDQTYYDALLRERDARPLQYEPTSPPSRLYVLVPDAMLNEATRLSVWLVHSIRFASKLPRKRRRTLAAGARHAPRHSL